MAAKILTAPQLDTLLAHVDARRHGDPRRDRALLLLSFRAGLRAAEIAALDWRDVTAPKASSRPS